MGNDQVVGVVVGGEGERCPHDIGRDEGTSNTEESILDSGGGDHGSGGDGGFSDINGGVDGGSGGVIGDINGGSGVVSGDR